MNESELTENANRQLNGKPPIKVVDDLANELCAEFDNATYRDWYCLVINILGVERINEIRARCKDGKYPGRLFSAIAGGEAKTKVGIDKFQVLKSRYGRR